MGRVGWVGKILDRRSGSLPVVISNFGGGCADVREPGQGSIQLYLYSFCEFLCASNVPPTLTRQLKRIVHTFRKLLLLSKVPNGASSSACFGPGLIDTVRKLSWVIQVCGFIFLSEFVPLMVLNRSGRAGEHGKSGLKRATRTAKHGLVQKNRLHWLRGKRIVSGLVSCLDSTRLFVTDRPRPVQKRAEPGSHRAKN